MEGTGGRQRQGRGRRRGGDVVIDAAHICLPSHSQWVEIWETSTRGRPPT